MGCTRTEVEKEHPSGVAPDLADTSLKNDFFIEALRREYAAKKFSLLAVDGLTRCAKSGFLKKLAAFTRESGAACLSSRILSASAFSKAGSRQPEKLGLGASLDAADRLITAYDSEKTCEGKELIYCWQGIKNEAVWKISPGRLAIMI